MSDSDMQPRPEPVTPHTPPLFSTPRPQGSVPSVSKSSRVPSASRSRSSKSSKLDTLIAIRKAKMEAATVALEYSIKETEIKKKQAQISAELDLLDKERQVAQAKAEYYALQESVSEGSTFSSVTSLPSSESPPKCQSTTKVLDISRIPQQDPVERTQQYVNSMQPINADMTADISKTNDITNFILKKELKISSMVKFNDTPESYRCWKATFHGMRADLGLTPREELDLLIKWLGPDSSRQASSIRTANPNNPVAALVQVWERLDERYGAPEMIESSLKKKLEAFPKITKQDYKKLYDLSDLLLEINSLKQDTTYKAVLSYFDTSAGVIPIVMKFPFHLQEKWTTHASNYKKKHEVPFPPFEVLVDFVHEQAKVKNDPGFCYELQKDSKPVPSKPPRVQPRVMKTDVIHQQHQQDTDPKKCPLHKTSHTLNNCRGFQAKSLDDRKKLLKEWNMCYKCCESSAHQARACTVKPECGQCNSHKHPTALHISTTEDGGEKTSGTIQDGGEKATLTTPAVVSVKCTEVCNSDFNGKSCGKNVLIKVYPVGQPQLSTNFYCIIDDQSNSSLASPEFFDHFGVNSDYVPYTLNSCAGTVDTQGRKASGFVAESLDGTTLNLPTLLECYLPNVRDEIPTPEIAKAFPHLSDVADFIPPLNVNAPIAILIGRDLIEAHHVLDQRKGPCPPYAQKLPLGWVLFGEVCCGKVHKTVINVNKTYILKDGRPSVFPPCNNSLFAVCKPDEIFDRKPDDNKVGMSREDKEFINIMDREFQQVNGVWVAPLPFRSNRPRLPNNKEQALKRSKTLIKSLSKDDVKRQQFVDFMGKLIKNQHCEVAPPLDDGEECWYLPIFGVYHPRKPDQVRVVFDSSAQFEGVSLNNVLLTGPNLTNSLLGILLRFRKEQIGVTMDVEQMFYCFRVSEHHRNYLRFLWHRDNNPDEPLIEYRMCVHVFGNSPSPAVATYGLRKTAQEAQEAYGSDMVNFVHRDFYVDDGVTSLPTADEAVDLVLRTQQALKTGTLRLHKVASNSLDVMKALPPEDLAKGLKEFDCDLPLQRSLGMVWDVNTDEFTFQVSSKESQYTRRGVLSTVNSLFDPLGLIAPVVVRGKIMLRDLMKETTDWDEPLPPDRQKEWEDWRESLALLSHVRIPRPYINGSFTCATNKEVLVYCDASEKAIGAVAYLRTSSDSGQQYGFILGKAKVAPSTGHTIPRLELCGAVLAVDIAETVSDHLNVPLTSMHFFTDSKIVLGYIHNQTRRFFQYVANRVDRIRRSTTPQQWSYVSTQHNPADIATRSVSPEEMPHSTWLKGPSKSFTEVEHKTEPISLINPELDKEVRPEIVSMTTNLVSHGGIGSHRFERFSSWVRLVETFVRLRHIVHTYQGKTKCVRWHRCQESKCVKAYNDSERYIIKSVQNEFFSKEVKCLQEGHRLPSNSTLLSLNPVLDENNMIRVGGRLNNANLDVHEKNPLIIPGRHHIATLLIRHYHEQVKHQGRHFTHGAVRTAGFWITGSKRLISALIHNCVQCRKLRGKQSQQIMADLPVDRLTPSPPFTYVGVDVFGPWEVVARRTRGGQACSKRWAVLFTCLVVRAIHIEVIEEMSASSFINSLRRFVAVRGKVKQFRSDRGTNFVGATGDMRVDALNVEEGPVQSFLYNTGVQWIFNPPHSSHMGGVWERMIGVSRRILDSMMSDMSARNLTHEVLSTFMAEVCAIVNARPIVPVSSDPENPNVLTPSILLTQKSHQMPEPLEHYEYSTKDLYKAQWKRVQCLADTFWKRWRTEYLDTLQSRSKWTYTKPNIKIGDLVLLKDKDVHRNQWPIGLVTLAIPSEDGHVRKAVIRVVKDGTPTSYTRPITELILLIPS